MKKILCIAALLVLAVILTGCGRSAYEPAEAAEPLVYTSTEVSAETPAEPEPPVHDPTEPTEVPEVYSPEPEAEPMSYTPELAVPIDRASQFFSEIADLFDGDNGELWGFKLHVPILFACPVTREAVANMPDPDGLFESYGDIYFGTLPESVTIFDAVVTWDYFGGKRWVIVPWAAIQRSDRAGRLRLLSHKAFHWHQFDGRFGQSIGWNNSHMNEKEARISIRLEINALLRALRVTGEQRYAAVSDALSIRAERRRLFDRAADENMLEMMEGLAQYTEWSLAPPASPGLVTLMESFADGMAQGISLEHSFGYLSGALYAFLLNETGVPWKDDIRFGGDLGLMLQEAMGIFELTPFGEVPLIGYGYNRIAADEKAWAVTREAILRDITEYTLNQPTLRFYHDDGFGLGAAFSGHRFSFYGLGTVLRGNIDYQDSFGRLVLRNGDFIMHNDGVIMVAALDVEMNGNHVSGANWELELNDGYEVVQVGEHFVVRRQ